MIAMIGNNARQHYEKQTALPATRITIENFTATVSGPRSTEFALLQLVESVIFTQRWRHQSADRQNIRRRPRTRARLI